MAITSFASFVRQLHQNSINIAVAHFARHGKIFAEIRRLSKKVSGSKIFRRDSSREKQGTRTISSLQSTDNQLTGVM